MKKRTLVTALVSLLVTLIGYLQVAAAPPPPVPIPVPVPVSSYSPLPDITEQTVLNIGPGQVGQLPLQLNTGDRVEGHVTVTADYINFIVRDPNDNTIVNAGLITDATFTFKAATRGTYQLMFSNSLFLVANKVVLVQVQHPGAAQFPYATGTYVTLRPGEVKIVTAQLGANQGVSGSLKIQGGQPDLVFSVTDPNGSTVVPASSISGSPTVAFAATVAGAYQLSFDNTSSAYTSKLITVDMRYSPSGQALWWGTATKLAFTTSPEGATTGTAFTTQPIVTVQDDTGNTAVTSSIAISLAITAGTGTSGAILSGTTTVNAVNGVAAFNGLSIDLPGAYTLTATATGLTPATGVSFNMTPLLPPNCVALNAGWNLISLPVVPTDPAITAVLSEILGGVISVWRYDTASASWLNYVPSFGGALTTMTDGNAYWINMSAPTILTINTSELTAKSAGQLSYQIAAGWNMIGFKATLPRIASDYLTGTSYRSFPLYWYASGVYSTINPSTDRFQPGLGYWVYFNAPGSIKP